MERLKSLALVKSTNDQCHYRKRRAVINQTFRNPPKIALMTLCNIAQLEDAENYRIMV